MIKLFWLLLSVACIGWYFVVLGYVAIRGAADIRTMLRDLAAKANESPTDEPS